MSGNAWTVAPWVYGALAVLGWFAAPWIRDWCNVPARNPWYHWRRVVFAVALFPVLVLAFVALGIAVALFVVASVVDGAVRGVVGALRPRRPAPEAGTTQGTQGPRA